VEVAYPSGLTARRDLAFGFGGEVSTDLTAVPVRLRDRRRGNSEPTPSALPGWVLAGGQALPLVAVEDGPGERLLGRAPYPPAAFEFMGRTRIRRGSYLTYDQGNFNDKGRGGIDSLRHEMKLGALERIRFIHPDARRYSDSDLVAELFPSSQDFTAADGGLY